MSPRPLVFLSGLAIGDYLLWNWSLNGNHDVLALVSGLTLPPLAVACLWLLALGCTRLVGRVARGSSARSQRRHERAATTRKGRGRARGTRPGLEEGADRAASSAAPSRKIAA